MVEHALEHHRVLRAFRPFAGVKGRSEERGRSL